MIAFPSTLSEKSEGVPIHHAVVRALSSLSTKAYTVEQPRARNTQGSRECIALKPTACNAGSPTESRSRHSIEYVSELTRRGEITWRFVEKSIVSRTRALSA
jgi:hypothetical protein